MKIIYYYIVYLKGKKNPNEIEIHLKPFTTRIDAEEFKERNDKIIGNRMVYSKIKKVDIGKAENGFWL